MSIKSGNSSLHEIGASPSANSGYVDSGNGGGNSGCVISPAPGLGLSAYPATRSAGEIHFAQEARRKLRWER